MATEELKQSELPEEEEPVDDQRVDAGLNGKVHHKTCKGFGNEIERG
jgi:hypothetical protein